MSSAFSLRATTRVATPSPMMLVMARPSLMKRSMPRIRARPATGTVPSAARVPARTTKPLPVTPERFTLALERARERAALWAQGDVRQGHLDALFAPPAAPDATGLDGDTLRRVRAALRDLGEASAAELGTRVGLSRVTAWRYLEHLVETGEASVGTDARIGGRPAKRYRRV